MGIQQDIRFAKLNVAHAVVFASGAPMAHVEQQTFVHVGDSPGIRRLILCSRNACNTIEVSLHSSKVSSGKPAIRRINSSRKANGHPPPRNRLPIPIIPSHGSALKQSTPICQKIALGRRPECALRTLKPRAVVQPYFAQYRGLFRRPNPPGFAQNRPNSSR